MISALLDNGANPKLNDNIVHICVRGKKVASLNPLFNKLTPDLKDLIEQPSWNGETPLYEACNQHNFTRSIDLRRPQEEKEFEKIVELLLKAGAQVGAICGRDEETLYMLLSD